MMSFLTDSRFFAVRLWAVIIVACLLSACSGNTAVSISKENDRLRRSNLQLDREVKELRKVVTQQADQLMSSDTPLAGAMAHRIALGRYSSGIDTDHDGHDDLIRLYVRPFDALDRFLPITGLATVQVAYVSADSVKLIAQKSYDRTQWDRAYRSGLTGTHYTLEMSLPPDVVGTLDEVTVKVQWTDLSGRHRLQTQKVLRLQ